MNNLDYYDWLEVDKTADQETIKRTYLTQASKWHPHKNPVGKSRCEKAFLELSEAFYVLSSPDLKALYDKDGILCVRSACKAHDLNHLTLEEALDIYNFASKTFGIISLCLQDEKWYENNEIFNGGLLKSNYGRFVLDSERRNKEIENVEKYVKTVIIERDGRRVKKTSTTLIRPDGTQEIIEEEKEEPICLLTS